MMFSKSVDKDVIPMDAPAGSFGDGSESPLPGDFYVFENVYAFGIGVARHTVPPEVGLDSIRDSNGLIEDNPLNYAALTGIAWEADILPLNYSRFATRL